MKKSILIVGGTGFFGQSFFDYINNGKLKHLNLSKIIIVSRKRSKIKSNISVSYIAKNIKDVKKIPYTDFLIYAANSKNNSENLKGFYNFKKILTDKNRKTKILFTSSGAVYGENNIKKKIKENSLVSFKKVSLFKGYKKNYSKCKITLENEIKLLGQKGFKVSIARLFTFIGKRILINKDFAVTNLINQALNKKNNKIFLNSSKDVYRGYMNSDDLIRWIIKIMINSSTKCNIYNVGSDEDLTIKDLAKIIAKKFDKKIIVKKGNFADQNIDYYVPSILKAKKNLNLKIKYKVKKSLIDLIKIYN